jgi:tRNA threonylcarbamoyl adenosine modification protein YjeE
VLKPGDLVTLSGGLGAGKTSFARALIRAIADDPDREVPSPTFPIRIDHTLARFTIVHCDLYRIESADDLEEIGLEETLLDAAVLVEWPELLPPGLVDNRLDVCFEIDGSGRRAQILGVGKLAGPARAHGSDPEFSSPRSAGAMPRACHWRAMRPHALMSGCRARASMLS